MNDSMSASLRGFLIAASFLLIGAAHLHSAVPNPISRWDFEGNARDSIGDLHAQFQSEASIVGGRLILNRQGTVKTAPLDRELTEKTLVALVKVEPVEQYFGAGGVMGVQSADESAFDAIGYAGSSWNVSSQGLIKYFSETGTFPEAIPVFVHIAVTFAADGTFTIYRNGRQHGQPYLPAIGLRKFGADSRILFGWPGLLYAEIEEAALYHRALTASEIAELAGVSPVDKNEPVVLELTTRQLLIEESKVGIIFVHRTGRLDKTVSATLEMKAGSAEVSGENPDLYLPWTGKTQMQLEFLPGQTDMAVRLTAF